MKQMKSKTYIFIMTLVMALVSCLENEIVYNKDNLDYRKVEVNAPLAKIHIPLYKMMCKHMDFGEPFIDDEGVVCIRYTLSDNIKWDDDIGIDDYSTGNNTWPFELGGLTLADSKLTGTRIYEVKLTTSDYAQDSYVNEAELTTGEISFALAGFGSLYGTIKFTILELTKDGIAFTQTVNLPSSGTVIYPLAGYKIKTNNSHLLMVICEIALTNTPSSSEVGIGFRLSDMKVNYMSGYFGQVDYNAEPEYDMELDFFDDLGFNGIVGFKDIKMDAMVTNKADLPINIEAHVLTVLDERLESNPPFDYIIPGATRTGNTLTVTPVVHPISITMPDIEFASGNYPKLEFGGMTNPNGNPNGDAENFIVKNADGLLAEVECTLTVPLHVKAEEYSRKDTLDFDYNEIVGNRENFVNNIEYVNLYILVNNGLPFDVTLDATVINESETFSSIVLSGARISSKTSEHRIEIILSDDLLEDFRTKEVKKIILQTTANTQDKAFVKVKGADFLDIDLSVRSKGRLFSIFFD